MENVIMDEMYCWHVAHYVNFSLWLSEFGYKDFTFFHHNFSAN